MSPLCLVPHSFCSSSCSVLCGLRVPMLSVWSSLSLSGATFPLELTLHQQRQYPLPRNQALPFNRLLPFSALCSGSAASALSRLPVNSLSIPKDPIYFLLTKSLPSRCLSSRTGHTVLVVSLHHLQ